MPAQAVEVPEAPALVHLKDHLDLPLTWTDEGAVLAEGGETLWSVLPVEAEGLAELEYEGLVHIVHDETGQCLAPEPMPLGADSAAVTLQDCAEDPRWSLLGDDRESRDEARIASEDGHLLGIAAGRAESGEEVRVFALANSRHGHEWLFSMPDEAAPPPPSATPSTAEVPAAQAKLPQTGTTAAVTAAAGLAAVAGGAALTLWWRRRTLRTQW